VDNVHARRLAAQLKAPVDSAKALEGLPNFLNGNIEPDSNRNRSRRIQDVMQAGNLKMKVTKVLVTKFDAKRICEWMCRRPRSSRVGRRAFLSGQSRNLQAGCFGTTKSRALPVRAFPSIAQLR